MKRMMIGLVACGALLGGTAAFAASGSYNSTTYGKEGAIAHQAPWEASHLAYKASPPDKMKCDEFVKSDDSYQNYVSAWMDGHKDKNLQGGIKSEGDNFRPGSVIALTTACKANPNKSVMAMANQLSQ